MSRALSIGVAAVTAVLLGVAWLGWIPGVTSSTITATALRALALMGLNLIFGVVGMLAFGQAAFMALPAYFAGIMDRMGVPLLIALPLALTMVVLLARAVAEVLVRLPGVYLAVGTLGFGMVVEGLARAFPSWTGGASGLVFEHGRNFGTNVWCAIAVVSLAFGVGYYVWYVRGAVWRRLRAIRHDELAASVLGIDVHREKAKIFTIGSAYSAVGGLLLFHYVGVLIPEDAGVVRSLEQIGTLLLGGAGFLVGPIVGAFLVDWFFVISGYAARYELVIYGATFLLVVMYAPQGVSGLLLRPWKRLAGDKAEKAPVVEIRHSVAAVSSDSRVSGRPCLLLHNVTQSFGGVHALVDISLDVKAGEVFTLVGPNGAGKTTLFNIVSGVLRPTSGRTLLDGVDITDLPVHRRAALIGRSFQTPRLVPELSVLANVMLRVDQLSPKLSEQARQAIALEQLRMFELENLSYLSVAEVGLGQRKLIDIARAAVGNPPIVLLDEPAVGLTSAELMHLSEMIRKLKRQGCAVVIVEHNIEFVSNIADRGIVLDSGREIARGTVRDIMAEESVKAAYFGALS
jgi:ABC-type branched-subunit amino acid transport system ATPase component/ABC-type branched-subunit amino acid transport system permease subunit